MKDIKKISQKSKNINIRTLNNETTKNYRKTKTSEQS